MLRPSLKHILVHVTTVPLTLITFFKGQFAFMHNHGFEVRAISSSGELLNQFSEQESVRTYAVDMRRTITPFRDIGVLINLWHTLRDIGPVIVHAHTPKGGLLGMLAAWLACVPVRIYHIHGLPLMTMHGIKRIILTWSERISCVCAHQVFCVSSSIRQVAINLHICPSNKIVVLASGTINGIDARVTFNPETLPTQTRTEVRHRYSITDDALVIGFVGRIVGDKGIHELVEAFCSIKSRYPNLYLLLVGGFEKKDPINNETLEFLQNSPHARLTGFQPDVPRFLAAMDLFVMPSYREGFGLSNIEAAAMQLPVVSTRIPGCVDSVQDGITGTLVPPHDPHALADAIRRYLDDPALRRQHGQAGRARVLRDFRPEDIWDATYQEYARLLRARGLPVPTQAETLL